MTQYIDPAGKLLQHMDRLHLLKSGYNPAPINIEIDLSNRCSLGCEWCHFAFTHTRGPLSKTPRLKDATPGGDLMPTDLAHRIIDQLVEAGVESITWTGGGEPTLHPDFDVIVRYAAAAGMAQGIYTNGCHIQADRAALMSEEFTFVYVSLDASTRASYGRSKGVDKFNDALQGIRRLALAGGGATVGIGYLVTAENWREVPHMIKLKDELGADYCQFRPTIMFDQDDPSEHSDDTDWMQDAIALLEHYEGAPGVEMDLTRMRRLDKWSGHGYKTCWWSALQSVITPNGKMWQCVNKREMASEEIGDLSEESFTEIWARHKPCKVSGNCRVMCRGHSANLALDQIMRPVAHKEFV